MADSTITDLPSATSVAGSEVLPIDQSGSTKKVAVADLTPGLDEFIGDGGSPASAKGLVPAASSGDAAAGKFLKADATWAVPSGGGGSGTTVYGVANGRLTLTSGTAVTTAPVTGATTVYWTSYGGNQIGLYNGSSWDVITFAETSLALGTLAAAFQAYDIFAYNNSGTLALEMLEWQNGTVTMTIASPCVVTWTGGNITNGMSISLTTSGALPTGLSANTQYYAVGVSGSTFNLTATPGGVAINTSGSQSGTHTGHCAALRQTALVLQDGVLVKSGDATRRYLGTFFATSTTATEDSLVDRYLFNQYNRIPRAMVRTEGTASWNYTTAVIRQANASTSNQLNYVSGDAALVVNASLRVTAANSGSACTVMAGVGVDSTTTVAGHTQSATTSGAAFNVNVGGQYAGMPGLGKHSIVWLEMSQAAGTTTFYGTSTVVGFTVQSGMIATVVM